MSGLKSRRKGYRGEYLLRDYFRKLGYEANRVPSSGAAEGFKGDVKISKGEESYLAEVKVRQNEFKSIYALYNKFKDKSLGIGFSVDTQSVIISDNFFGLGFLMPHNWEYCLTDDKRTLKKLMGLKKLVKECNFLVLKIDRQPFLFVRYL